MGAAGTAQARGHSCRTAQARSFARLSLILLTLAHITYADTDSSSNSSSARAPRVTGRIVKLYTHARQEGFRCAEEGFHADPANCAVFYRCAAGGGGKFTTFKFQCGPGTVYDPEIGICNFPSSTRRAECGGDPKLAAPSTDGSSENEVDSNGSDQKPPSPITTKDPNEARYTNAKAELSTTAAPWYISTRQQTSRPKPQPANKLAQTVKASPSDVNTDQCTTDGFMGDSKNCKKFYRCVANGRGGFIRYEFSCSESTVWDDNVQACNHAWASRSQRCGRGEVNDDNKKPSQETTETNSQSQTQVNHGSNSSQKPTQENYEDRVKQNQYQYNNGSHSSQTQSQINHYSDSKSQSQKQINFGDYNTQSQTQINHSKQTSQTQTQSNDKPNTSTSQGYYDANYKPSSDEYDKTSTQSSENSGSNTDDKCTSSGFMGDSKNCKIFYRCVDNGRGSFTKYEFSCGEGTVWDSNTEACNHIWAVKECGGNKKDDVNKVEQTTKSDTTPSQSTNTAKPTQPTVQSTTDNIDDYDQGYGQQTQRPTSQQAQTPSAVESTMQQTSAKPSNNDDNKCTSSGFMGDTEDCKKFYRCVDNGRGSYTRYEFSCGEGTVWDPNVEACNHEWAVEECGGKSKGDVNKIEKTTKSEQITTQRTTSQPTTENLDDNDPGYGQQQTESQQQQTMTTTTNKNDTPNEGNECTASGFMGDSNDCKKFYRCVDNGRGGFIKYEFSCGDGTLWDSDIDACNHQNSVKRPCSSGDNNSQSNMEPQTTVKQSSTERDPGSTEPTQTEEVLTETTTKRETKPSSNCNREGFVGDENDCKQFYRCVDNGQGGFTKYEFRCGDGTVWDQDIQACNHEAMVKNCGTTGSTNNDSGFSPEVEHDETQEGQMPTQQPTPSDTTTDAVKPPVTDDKCSAEGFYPDSNDCKKFYRCVDNGRGGYTKYDFTCGDGTVWDQDIQACNHPMGDKQCGGSSSQTNKPDNSDSGAIPSQQEASSTTTEEESTSKHDESASQSTTLKPTQSSGECSSEGFYPDKNDCKKFYRCVDNGKGGYTKYEFACGDGTVWDQEIQGCNFESSVKKCGQGTDSSSTTRKTETSQNDMQQTTERLEDEYVTPESDTEQTTSKKPLSNEGECTSEGFYANENNCKKFYRCVDNGRGGYTKYDFDCGEGTAWDQDAQTCNHEGSVDCRSSTQNEQTKPQQTQTEKPESETNTQESTTRKESSSESSSEENTTNKQQSSNDKCEQEGYFGNSKDCKKFYRCVDNGKGGYTKYDFDCGEGTIWDQDLTTCNHPGDVSNPSCSSDGSQSTQSSAQPTQQTTSTTTINSISSEPQQSSSSSEPESTSKPSKSNITCPEAGFYANPDDCKKFYRCVDYEGDGKSYTVFHFDCGEGTIWDPNLDTCNYEDSIYPPRDCSKQTQSQEVESTKEPDSTTSSSSGTTTTTTQQSTTEEQTTTESQTTTTQSSTQESTTKQQTTQEQTTQQQTTQEQTTQQQTTQEQTTQQQTTQEQTTQSTTEQQTTAQQETTQSTTTESTTTQQTTTQESTTKEQTTTSQEETTTQESTTTQGNTQDETTTQGGTTESQTTEEGTTQQQTESQTDTTTETESQQSTTEQNEGTESSSSNKECPETEDDQNLYVCPTGFRRHPKYCNLFYQCTEDNSNHDLKIAVFHCQNNTIYDESKTQCVEESQADKKCNGERAEKRRFKRLDDNSKPPISVAKNSLRCPSEGHFPFDRKDNCSPAFLKCQRPLAAQKIRGLVYRCPDGFFYWAVSRRCERMSTMRECKGTNNVFKGRWEIPVETFNIAP